MSELIKTKDKIAIICPASPAEKNSFSTFINKFPEYEFVSSPLIYDKTDNNDQKHIAEIEKYFSDQEIKAIFCGRGGYGTIRKLDKINYDIIQSNPKPFFGFSDITALQLAFYKKANLKSYTGLTLKQKNTQEDDFMINSLKSIINKEPQVINNIKLEGNSVSGKIIGGNLSLIAPLVGTPFLPDFSNKILVIEDIAEPPYKIDKMLHQLYLAGCLSNLKALIFGSFLDCINPTYPDGKTVTSYIKDFAKKLNCPIVYNFPYGHDHERIIFQYDADCEINNDSIVIY